MAEILSQISVACFILAGGFLVLTVFLWFRFDILKVIDDLSLRTAKKQIAKIREQNEKTGNKSFRPSDTNMMRGKLTDTMADLEDKEKYSIGKRTAPADDDRMETGVLEENRAETLPLQDETALLDGSDVQAAADDDGTVLLDQTQPPEMVRRSGGVKMTMLDEVILIHTDEEIC